jgi:hypothetical protein
MYGRREVWLYAFISGNRLVMCGQLYGPSTGTTGYVAETRYTEWQTETLLMAFMSCTNC